MSDAPEVSAPAEAAPETHDNRALGLAALDKALADVGTSDAPEESEPAQAEEKDEEKKSKDTWRGYARKAAKLKAEREAFANERAAFAAERGTLESAKSAAARLAKIEALRDSDVEALLEEIGVPFDELTKRMIERGTTDEKTSKLEKELRQLKRDAEEKEKAAAERAARAEAMAFRAKVRNELVETTRNEAAFPYTFDSSPAEVLADVDKMADAMVEDGDDKNDDGFIDRLLKNVEKLNQVRHERAVKKYLAKNGGTVKAAEAAVVKEAAKEPPKRGKTLSARDTKDAATKLVDDDDFSDEARRKRALAALDRHAGLLRQRTAGASHRAPVVFCRRIPRADSGRYPDRTSRGANEPTDPNQIGGLLT